MITPRTGDGRQLKRQRRPSGRARHAVKHGVKGRRLAVCRQPSDLRQRPLRAVEALASAAVPLRGGGTPAVISRQPAALHCSGWRVRDATQRRRAPLRRGAAPWAAPGGGVGNRPELRVQARASAPECPTPSHPTAGQAGPRAPESPPPWPAPSPGPPRSRVAKDYRWRDRLLLCRLYS